MVTEPLPGADVGAELTVFVGAVSGAPGVTDVVKPCCEGGRDVEPATVVPTTVVVTVVVPVVPEAAIVLVVKDSDPFEAVTGMLDVVLAALVTVLEEETPEALETVLGGIYAETVLLASFATWLPMI